MFVISSIYAFFGLVPKVNLEPEVEYNLSFI